MLVSPLFILFLFLSVSIAEEVIPPNRYNILEPPPPPPPNAPVDANVNLELPLLNVDPALMELELLCSVEFNITTPGYFFINTTSNDSALIRYINARSDLNELFERVKTALGNVDWEKINEAQKKVTEARTKLRNAKSSFSNAQDAYKLGLIERIDQLKTGVLHAVDELEVAAHYGYFIHWTRSTIMSTFKQTRTAYEQALSDLGCEKLELDKLTGKSQLLEFKKMFMSSLLKERHIPFETETYDKLLSLITMYNCPVIGLRLGLEVEQQQQQQLALQKPFCRSVDFSNMLYSEILPSAKGEKQLLIFLHGLLGSSRNWRSIGRKIASETAWSVALVDLRNHGRSFTDPDLSIPLMEGDLLKKIDSFHPQFPLKVLSGHSLGGFISMHAAHAADGLILVDISPNCRSLDKEKQLAFNMQLIKDLKAAIVSRLPPKDFLIAKGYDPFLSEWVVSTNFGNANLENRLVTLERFVASRWLYSGIPNFVYKKPVLIIKGANSSYVSEADLPDIQSTFPYHIIKSVAGAGHWVHSDAPEECIAEMTNFLQRFSNTNIKPCVD